MSDTSDVVVHLFGAVRVCRGAESCSPPPGSPSELLRIVAAHGAIHVDELMDILWPESATPMARRARLRTVLARLRSRCGGIVVRVGDTITVPEDVQVDVLAFESAARRALGLPPNHPSRAPAAHEALRWCVDDLLPEDQYRDWSANVRARIRRYRLDLLEVVAEAAVAEGDVPRAVRFWHEATEIDPYDETHYVKLASLFFEQGRWGAGESVIRRAESSLATLDVPLSPQLAGLRERYLRRGRPTPG